MTTLLRLATWGAAAAVALLIAVLTATTDIGAKRLATTAAKASGRSDRPPTVVAAPDPAQVARLAETESETRRLSEAVRTLHSDRERLLERIASLERNLEDVTGSIRQQAQTAAAPAPPPTVQPAEPAVSSATSETTGAVDRAPNGDAEASKPEPQPALGIDIGGAPNFDGLRALWRSISKAHPDLVDGLHPVVIVREITRTRNAELRLIAGPLPDVETAARLCTTLAATRRYCRPVAFEGQHLVLSVPAPVRRPAAERKSARPRANP
jgi:hypothetical protein